MGNFAQQVHPLVDSVELTVRRVNSTIIDTFSVRILHSKILNFDLDSSVASLPFTLWISLEELY